MKPKNTDTRKPISEDIIYRNMMIAVFAVGAIFLIKNLIGDILGSALVIGVCLALFAVLAFIMRKKQVAPKTQQLTLCLSIVFLVFCISLNSGSYYSDDFPLYLAVIALSGLYLTPQYTLIQAALIDVLLLVAYFIHPEKADPFSQYLMCVFLLSVCAFSFYMVIKRGRAYIEIGESRAKEAELLLAELKDAGERLQDNCEHSAERISSLEHANQRLQSSIGDLQEGSLSITRGTGEVSQTFDNIQGKMQITREQVSSLNEEVKKVEVSLADSKSSMNEMDSEMLTLKETIAATDEVFTTLHTEIKEIVQFTKQLNKIANNTTTLALNASIEAARAGQMGAGFAVVASKVQTLAEDSNQCSSQIASVVNAMENLLKATGDKLSDSQSAIDHSLGSLDGFQSSFEQLMSQFNALYANIEAQNESIRDMENRFIDLKECISDMASSSEENQTSVNAITDSIDVYKNTMDKIVDDNLTIRQLSASLLESASQTACIEE